MVKNKPPAFLFYPNDWTRDLEEHPLEIEGAWIRIINKLWFAEKKGELSRNILQWSRILRVPPKDAERILNYIKDEKIGNVTLRNGDSNALITVVSRRMQRDDKARQQNKVRQNRYRSSRPPLRKSNARSNANVTPPSSSSISCISTDSDIQDTNCKKHASPVFQKREKGSTDRPPGHWTAEDIKAKAWEIQDALDLEDSEHAAIMNLVCNHFSRINPALTATRDRIQTANEATAGPIGNVMAYFTAIVKGEADE